MFHEIDDMFRLLHKLLDYKDLILFIIYHPFFTLKLIGLSVSHFGISWAIDQYYEQKAKRMPAKINTILACSWYIFGVLLSLRFVEREYPRDNFAFWLVIVVATFIGTLVLSIFFFPSVKVYAPNESTTKNYQPKPTERVIITPPPKPKVPLRTKPPDKKSLGEYIDFEEV